jgi:hypothetical protein
MQTAAHGSPLCKQEEDRHTSGHKQQQKKRRIAADNRKLQLRCAVSMGPMMSPPSVRLFWEDPGEFLVKAWRLRCDCIMGR